MTEPAPTNLDPEPAKRKRQPAESFATIWFIVSALVGAVYIFRGEALGWVIAGIGVLTFVTVIRKYDD